MSGTGNCLRTSASSICARACCAAAPSGGRPRARPPPRGRGGRGPSRRARRRGGPPRAGPPAGPRERSLPAVRDQVVAALSQARHTGWQGLLDDQRAYLDEFWNRADVELEGDTELQQAVRFALFHTLQAGARAEQRAIAAKGLTGPGYDGHTFWDTERFVLPVLTYTAPYAPRDPLLWRHSTLALARERARQLGLDGAAFPWRTIRGQECSGYWPAGTAAFHISANVADAVVRYQNAVDDEVFELEAGLEMLVDTARP